jgi:hypothetical protein
MHEILEITDLPILPSDHIQPQWNLVKTLHKCKTRQCKILQHNWSKLHIRLHSAIWNSTAMLVAYNIWLIDQKDKRIARDKPTCGSNKPNIVMSCYTISSVRCTSSLFIFHRCTWHMAFHIYAFGDTPLAEGFCHHLEEPAPFIALLLWSPRNSCIQPVSRLSKWSQYFHH